MALDTMSIAAPSSTRASRYYTMTNPDQNARRTSETTTITELVTAGPGNSARYFPSAPNASYIQGAINAALYGDTVAYTAAGLGLQVPIINNALVNQSMFFSSIGSVAMSFNLSQNQRALRQMIENFVEETEERDPIVMSREIERAICESAVRSPSMQDFVSATIGEFQQLVAHQGLLAEIYNEMQAVRLHEELVPVELIPDWEAIANGVDPYTRMENANQQESIDPIASSNFTPIVITPPPIAETMTTAPTIVQYIDQSAFSINATPVNTLVVVGNIPPPAPPQSGRFGPASQPGGPNGY